MLAETKRLSVLSRLEKVIRISSHHWTEKSELPPVYNFLCTITRTLARRKVTGGKKETGSNKVTPYLLANVGLLA